MTRSADQQRGSWAAVRPPSEDLTLALADRGVRSAALRLPPTVHGEGDHGSMARIVAIARDAGFSAYIGEEGVPTREIAEVIGRKLGIPVRSMSPGEAPEHFGFLAGFFGRDLPASSELTRERFGWSPEGPGLLDDLEHAGYADAPVEVGS